LQYCQGAEKKVTYRPTRKAPRLDLDIIKNWKDQEISKLVLEYYDIFDRANKNRGGLQQALGELTKLKACLNNRKFKNFVEIGIADGGSFWMYGLMFCTPASKMIGIDSHREHSATLIMRELEARGRNVRYIIADCNRYVRAFTNESIDLLHIDANHDYDDVRRYFENYYPKVVSGGIILIHDTAACEGSIKFRKEVLESNIGLVLAEGFYDHRLLTGNWLITGEYDINPDLPSPGISLIRKH